MAKYIERETLISALESEFEDNENCRLFVSEIPTADVVEVVRCKDCANGCHKTDKTVVCKILNKLMITEDYCSYGAPEEREGNVITNSK